MSNTANIIRKNRHILKSSYPANKCELMCMSCLCVGVIVRMGRLLFSTNQNDSKSGNLRLQLMWTI